MKNADKTHCKRGHEYTPDNTKTSAGNRQCRTCIREQQRIGPPPKSAEERFWEKVDKSIGLGPEGECWHWIGERTDKGYGRLSIKGRNVGAHRLSYLLHNGPFNTDLFICHHCDNPQCVNPAHLFPGTQLDNMRDKMAKGRHKNGAGAIASTHCSKGHEYSFTPKGQKVCRECNNSRDRAQRLLAKAA